MDSSRTRNVSKRSDPVNFPAKSSISSRRSLSSSSSFSSFSSCSSSSPVFPGDSPLNSPATPLRLLGVPFSWEQLPGKPKDYSHRLNNRRNDESSNILPLPPHRSMSFPATGKNPKSNRFSKKHSFPVTVRDPFAAALLECSKEEGTNSDDEDDVNGGEEVDGRFRENSGCSSQGVAKEQHRGQVWVSESLRFLSENLCSFRVHCLSSKIKKSYFVRSSASSTSSPLICGDLLYIFSWFLLYFLYNFP